MPSFAGSRLFPYVCFFIALFAYAIFGHLTTADHDIFGDARLEAQMAEDNWQLAKRIYHEGKQENPHDQIVFNLEYYGTAFNAVSYLLQKLVMPEAGVQDYRAHKFKQHHVFLASLIDILLVALMLRWLTGNPWVMLPAIGLLALQPVYFGAAFNNIKDIPFSVTITLAGIASAWSAAHIAQLLKQSGAVLPKLLLASTAAGLSVGLCASIRLGGISVGIFWIAALLMALILARPTINLRNLLLVGAAGFACALMAFVCIWALHPVAWFRPVGWILETIDFHAHHPNPGITLTNGEWIKPSDTPWYYLPEWILAKMPLGILLLTLFGFIILWLDFFKRSSLFLRCLTLTITLQLLWFPLLSIAVSANLYNGMRHFLMICPAIAICVGYGGYALLTSALTRRIKTAISIGFVAYAALIAYELTQLHPFQVNYISEWRRHDPLHERWSMRYEGMSLVDWLVETNRIEERPVYLTGAGGWLVGIYMEATHNKPILFQSIRRTEAPKDVPYWMITFSRRPLPEEYQPFCSRIHAETQSLGSHTILLGELYDCRPDTYY